MQLSMYHVNNHTFMCLYCMYGFKWAHPLPRIALDLEMLIAGTEMRSRPYLVLEETQPYFIISWFHALGSLANLLNLQGPQCKEALIRTEDGRGQDARKKWERTDKMIQDIFLQFPLAIPPSPLYHSNPFSQPAAWKWLVPTHAPFTPHYLQTKWCLMWHLKASIQIEVSLLKLLHPDCPSKSNVSLHFQLKAQSLTAPFKPVSPSRLCESASLKSRGTANSRKTARTKIQTSRMHVS